MAYLMPSTAVRWAPASAWLQLWEELLNAVPVRHFIQPNREPTNQTRRDHRTFRQGAVPITQGHGQGSGRNRKSLKRKLTIRDYRYGTEEIGMYRILFLPDIRCIPRREYRYRNF
jgi:hypothetical protein